MATPATTLKPPAADLATLREVDQKALEALEETARKCGLFATEGEGQFRRAFKLSAGIAYLRNALTAEVMAAIMPLQGSALGFITDKDKEGGYPLETVRDCLIEATLQGLFPVNNEFNIISGRCYAAKNGLGRRIREVPGLTDFSFTLGVPAAAAGGAVVSAVATWRLNGRLMRLERTQRKLEDGTFIDERIPVRVNQGQIVDAILGKAERKLYAAVLKKITGSEIADGDAIDVTPVGPGTGSRTDRLAEALGAAPQGVDPATGEILGEPKGGAPMSEAEKARANDREKAEAAPKAPVREPGDETEEAAGSSPEALGYKAAPPPAPSAPGKKAARPFSLA